jgi:phosphomannomutase
MPDTLAPENLAAVFKAYDVRGLVGDQLDEELTHRIGGAFVVVTGARTVVVGHDMRSSSPGMAGAFADGAAAAGADVVLIGLASTDQLYFASGHLGHPGAMFTASHNPAAYNGIKLCRAGAAPIGMETGLAEIRDRVAAGEQQTAPRPGSISSHDVLAAYAAHLLSLALVEGRRLKVVVDAGNGMAGLTAPAVFERLGGDRAELVPMYFELDGSFPNHEANPIEPENLVDLQKRVVAEDADIGLAFDGDADRCFLVDERGRLVSPSTLTALIAARELAREPGSTVIHNLITSRAVPEIVTELGGTPVRTRVGHSFIKATMAETDAVFGGEHSGHFYFRDFWRADSGMLAALHAMAALAEGGRPLSALLADYERFVASGEINSTVADQQAVLATLEREYAGRPGVEVDGLDGLTVTHDDWWFNVRASNTEPLLRLNAEGKDDPTMAGVRDAVLAVIRSDQ